MFFQTASGRKLSSASHTANGHAAAEHHHHQQQHQQHSQNARLIRVLVGISLLFVCCQSLKTVPDVYEMTVCSSLGAAERCEEPDAIRAIVKVTYSIKYC